MGNYSLMFTDEEQKKFDNMLKGQDIQFMSANDNEIIACLDKRKIRHRAFIVCRSNLENTTCFFKLGDKIRNNSSKAEDSYIRVFIDRRKKDEIKLLINDNGDLIKYSQKFESMGNKERLILFLEDEFFAQLIIFDESIANKVNYMISKNSLGMDALRGIVQSFIGLLVPDWNISELLDEGVHWGDEHEE